MAKRVFAKVRPEILRWARESAGLSLLDAATALVKTSATLADWEGGTAAPSIPQLREMAQLYKRPLAVFYLQQVPTGFQVLSDFRRLPGTELRHFSPELTQEIRVAHQRRELALELLADIGEEPKTFELELQLDSDPESAGAVVRKYLGISDRDLDDCAADATGRVGFNWWRKRIEDAGVLVFQATRIMSEEASGFAIAFNVLPTVVVNRKDAPVRRLFSLAHEFVHLALHRSGVSELDVDAARPPEDSAVEIFCNRVAAAILVPRDRLLSEATVLEHGNALEWSDAEIGVLGKRFNLSREAILRRLLAFGRTSPSFYQRKRADYAEEFRLQKLRERELSVPKPIPRNMPQEALSNFGRPFVEMVFDSYRQDRLTLSDVSGYLGLRTHHVAKLQSKLEGY
jgi:Zn-dependent peptidase ImmA (M78 family)/transcriptional regulator with XRE-family HTH domain